ncbi:MAG TPA: serine/threonine-protein kinase [Minicystis sp.]|nr:serine/threonine-protein kinase [Minicystis sp.]
MYCRRCHRRYEDDSLFCAWDGEKLSPKPLAKHVRHKPSELAGATLGGRYQIRGLLGRGALSQVLLAKDLTTEEPVALKVLEAKHLKEPKKRARFLLEAKAMSELVHPHVAAVIDVGLCDDGAPYLALEYLLGESLGSYLRREKRIDPELGVALVRHVAAGLAHAHGMGVVHRDVKPDNVFLVGEIGKPHTAKIVDFGLARVAEQRGLTMQGTTVGTIQYMAPEQAVADETDPRTDVYGLGVLLYRALSGRLPFDFDDESKVLAHQLAAPPPPPALGEGPLARDLAAIIVRTLRKKKENRYPTMAALEADLARAGTGARLAAAEPLAAADDTYVPASAFAERAAAFLKKRLG